jgi:5-methyltetrahydrofolate corrinoid/iron sulfur protein methyltransferase
MLIIGELINTSRKLIREAVEKKDAEYIQQIVKAQEGSGASYLDVNCGTFTETEVTTMEWLVDIIQKVSSLPLCIDSPNASALEAGLKKATNGVPIINSITDETPRWNAVAPLIKKYNAKIIALCINDKGMPKTQEDRLSIADSLITKLTKDGIAIDNIYIDPLIKPISTGDNNGIEVLEAIRKIMQTYPGVHTVCGLTNISYSLPSRPVINRTFMIQTMAYGMDSYIIDPTNKEMKGALVASQALLGQDKFCRKFITGFREGIFN